MAKIVEYNSLEREVLEKIIHEGEILVQAQLQSALGADQRAMSWISIIATLATAAFGAAAWVTLSGYSMIVGGLLLLLAFSLIVSGYIASHCVRPALFQLPGNEPENWLYWEDEVSVKHGLIEQARNIDHQVKINRAQLEKSAKLLQHSIDIFFWAIAFVAVLSLPALFLASVGSN